jgi:hypothetical protein
MTGRPCLPSRFRHDSASPAFGVNRSRYAWS